MLILGTGKLTKQRHHRYPRVKPVAAVVEDSYVNRGRVPVRRWTVRNSKDRDQLKAL